MASVARRPVSLVGVPARALLAVVALAVAAGYALAVTDIALLQPATELFRALGRGTTVGFPAPDFARVFVPYALLALGAALLAARGPVASLFARPLGPARRALLATAPLLASPLALAQDETTRRGAVLAVLVGLAALATGYLARDPARGDPGDAPLPPPRAPRAWLAAHYPVLAGMALHLALFSWVTITRDRAHWAGMVDLGIFKEALWNTLHGHGVLYSPTVGYSFLGEHFSPVLFLLLPLYAVAPTSGTLLVAQAAAIALAAWPIYRLALALGLGRALATALALAMIFAPGVQAALLYDFHMDLLAVPALAWALWAAYARRWVALAVAAAVVCSVKEDAFVALTGVAAAVFVDPRNRALDPVPGRRLDAARRFAIGLELAVLAYCLLAMFVLLKRFGPPPGVPEYMADGTTQGYKFFRNFSHLQGPGGPLRMLLGMPVRFALWAVTALRFTTLCVLLGPVLFAPLFAGRRVVVLTPLAVLLLTDNPDVTEMRYHYGAIQHPPVYAAAAFGMAAWLARAGAARAPGLRRALVAAVAAAAIVMASTHPGSLASVSYPRDFVRPTPRTAAIDALARRVPPDAAVSATSIGGTMFSNRAQVRAFPYATDAAQYVLCDLQRPSWPANPAQRDAAVQALWRDPRWGVLGVEQGAVLLGRGQDRARNREAGRALFVHRRWEVEGTEETDYPDTIERDPDASDGWARVVYPSNRHTGRFVVYGPGLRLTPGRWRATFRLRARPTRFGGDVGAVDVFSNGSTLADHTLMPEDFPTPGWHDVAVEFDSNGVALLEFRVAYDHQTVLGADTISLDPVGQDDAAVLNLFGL